MNEQAINKEKLGFVYKLFKAMQKNNLNYIYRGAFSSNITDNILSLAETNLVKKDDPRMLRRKVYNVMVEGLQNITKHQANLNVDNKKNYGVFVLKKEHDKYFITTGNLIKNSEIDNLSKQIDQVNSLDKEGLTAYHREVLLHGKISDKGGAGLGLIDMARKSGNKLLYAFENLDQQYSYFYLHTEIPSKKTPVSSLNTKSSGILSYISALHKMLNDENVLIIFNSYFNQDSLMNLLSIIEKQMMHSLQQKKRIYHTMVEMFQNIIQHGDDYQKTEEGKAGLFFISETEKEYFLNTGNYILNKKIPVLTEKINHVNSLNEQELEEFYNHRLLDFDIDTNKEAGLGIIDIRMKTDDKLEYYFLNIDDKYSFYSLRAKIIKI